MNSTKDTRDVELPAPRGHAPVRHQGLAGLPGSVPRHVVPAHELVRPREVRRLAHSSRRPVARVRSTNRTWVIVAWLGAACVSFVTMEWALSPSLFR